MHACACYVFYTEVSHSIFLHCWLLEFAAFLLMLKYFDRGYFNILFY
jgi:hypothetical protein